MMAATSVVTERSPYIVRTSFSVPQTTVPLATWAAENGIKRVVTVVSDYAPGIDVETAFKQRFEALGGRVIESLRVPLAVRISRRICSVSRRRNRTLCSDSFQPE